MFLTLCLCLSLQTIDEKEPTLAWYVLFKVKGQMVIAVL